MQEFLFKYGLPGAIIFALGWYVLSLEERHRKERKEWRESLDQQRQEDRRIQETQFERMNDTADNTNQVIRETGNILSGLKTLLENQIHRRS